jgi:hypothetical protein
VVRKLYLLKVFLLVQDFVRGNPIHRHEPNPGASGGAAGRDEPAATYRPVSRDASSSFVVEQEHEFIYSQLIRIEIPFLILRSSYFLQSTDWAYETVCRSIMPSIYMV